MTSKLPWLWVSCSCSLPKMASGSAMWDVCGRIRGQKTQVSLLEVARSAWNLQEIGQRSFGLVHSHTPKHPLKWLLGKPTSGVHHGFGQARFMMMLTMTATLVEPRYPWALSLRFGSATCETARWLSSSRRALEQTAGKAADLKLNVSTASMTLVRMTFRFKMFGCENHRICMDLLILSS